MAKQGLAKVKRRIVEEFSNLSQFRDYELEKGVLAFIISNVSGNAYETVSNYIIEDCFYDTINKKVFQVVKTMFDEGFAIDMVSVPAYLKNFARPLKLTNEYLSEHDRKELTKDIYDLFDDRYFRWQSYGNANSVMQWCMWLRELAAKRHVETLNSAPEDLEYEDVFETAISYNDKLKRILEVKNVDDWKKASDVGLSLYKEIHEKKPNEIVGFGTGISEFDNNFGRFRSGNLVIIAARPSCGKSAFMGQIAVHIAKQGDTVGVISLEMRGEDIMQRMLANEADTDMSVIDRNSFYSDNERTEVMNELSKLSELPIYFSDCFDVNTSDLSIKLERLKTQKNMKVAIIDYLQLIEPLDADLKATREQQVSKMTRTLKRLAASLEIPIILLAQLNRQAKESKKPELHHLRESGSIEQDADIVLFLHNPFKNGEIQDENGESWEGKIQVLNRKWRNGKSDMDITLGYEPAKMKFFDLSQKPPQPKQQAAAPQTPQKKQRDDPFAGFQKRTVSSTAMFEQEEKDDLPF